MVEYNDPRTSLEDLVSYYKEIKEEENLAMARIEAGFDAPKIFEGLKLKRMAIDACYLGVVDFSDCYVFSELEEIKDFLEEVGQFDEKKVHVSIQHEKMHAEEAISQGFDIGSYICWLVNTETGMDYVLGVRIETDCMISLQTYHDITYAPDEPSYGDKLAGPRRKKD